LKTNCRPSSKAPFFYKKQKRSTSNGSRPIHPSSPASREYFHRHFASAFPQMTRHVTTQHGLLHAFLAAVPFVAAVNAVPPAPSADPEAKEGSEVNLENDRTSNRTRMRREDEFIDYQDGESRNTLTYSGSYAVGFRGRKDWQFTIDWPLVSYHAAANSTLQSATGLGDVKLTLNHAFESSRKIRWNIGMDLQLDTARKLGLGDGMYVLSPFAGFSWRFCERAKLTASFKYNQSVATKAGVSERQTLEFRPGVEVNLPGRSYGYVEYAPKWDFAQGSSNGSFNKFAGSSLKFELGRSWDRDERLVVAFRYEMPLTESSRSGTYVLGVTYRFK
jgi:hypothetical protein